MRVAIVGGTGMIGTALGKALRRRGDQVVVLTRRAREADHVQWGPSRGIHQLRRLEGIDAVVNLNGAPLADRTWTQARRKVLRDSRVEATEILLRSLSQLEAPPSVFVGLGTLGRFGDRGEAWIDDDDEPGTGFLAELAVEWENAHLRASEVIGARSVVLRCSIVLSAHGGAFPLMLVPFRYGFGGWLGNGRQYTAWISIEDCVGSLLHMLDTPSCRGGFNGSVPEPDTNKEWCKALGRAMERPVRTHAPKWALRGALGEMANDIFLASCRARPRKLLESGFEFQNVDIETTFRDILVEMD